MLGNVSNAVKQSYIDRIDRMEAEYQKAGSSGSFNAGVEGGKLVNDIAGLLAGGAGVVKGGALLTEKVVAQVVGAVIAQAQGNSVLSGTSGAALGEFIAQEMYPGIARTNLNEEQKQTIIALGTLAAWLAGGLVNGSASGVIACAQAGKNALENNALNSGYDEEEHEREHGNPPQKLFKLSPRSSPLQDADGRTIPGGAIIGPGAVPIKGSNEGVTTVVVDKSKYPEAAQHIEDAQNSGHPLTMTIDSPGAAKRRREALKDTQPVPCKDRDEYPPAMFKEGGAGSSVRQVNPSDNRGAGACIGIKCRGLPDGTTVIIKSNSTKDQK
ncbi:Deoxyribonuclease NucA/NucB [Pantoea ananatis]|nr:Deoxyribonuclease NucA/NucB [Pantoea ananatis]